MFLPSHPFVLIWSLLVKGPRLTCPFWNHPSQSERFAPWARPVLDDCQSLHRHHCTHPPNRPYLAAYARGRPSPWRLKTLPCLGCDTIPTRILRKPPIAKFKFVVHPTLSRALLRNPEGCHTRLDSAQPPPICPTSPDFCLAAHPKSPLGGAEATTTIASSSGSDRYMGLANTGVS